MNGFEAMRDKACILVIVDERGGPLEGLNRGSMTPVNIHPYRHETKLCISLYFTMLHIEAVFTNKYIYIYVNTCTF